MGILTGYLGLTFLCKEYVQIQYIVISSNIENIIQKMRDGHEYKKKNTHDNTTTNNKTTQENKPISP